MKKQKTVRLYKCLFCGEIAAGPVCLSCAGDIVGGICSSISEREVE